jgi:hypothetical protein
MSARSPKSHRTEDGIHLNSTPKQFYHGLASAIYSAIVSKLNWWDKIARAEVVAKWKQELLEQLQPGTAECSGLPPDGVSRLVDVVIASLTRSRVGAVAPECGGEWDESKLVSRAARSPSSSARAKSSARLVSPASATAISAEGPKARKRTRKKRTLKSPAAASMASRPSTSRRCGRSTWTRGRGL